MMWPAIRWGQVWNNVCGVEDTEVRYLLECPRFSGLRDSYIASFYFSTYNERGMKERLLCKDQITLNNLAIF